MLGWRRHVPDIQTEQEAGNYSSLSHDGPHDTTSGDVCSERRFERPVRQVRRDGVYVVRWEIKER